MSSASPSSLASNATTTPSNTAMSTSPVSDVSQLFCKLVSLPLPLSSKLELLGRFLQRQHAVNATATLTHLNAYLDYALQLLEKATRLAEAAAAAAASAATSSSSSSTIITPLAAPAASSVIAIEALLNLHLLSAKLLLTHFLRLHPLPVAQYFSFARVCTFFPPSLSPRSSSAYVPLQFFSHLLQALSASSHPALADAVLSSLSPQPYPPLFFSILPPDYANPSTSTFACCFRFEEDVEPHFKLKVLKAWNGWAGKKWMKEKKWEKEVEYLKTDLVVRWIAVTPFGEKQQIGSQSEAAKIEVWKKQVLLGEQIAREAVKFISSDWSTEPAATPASTTFFNDPVISTLATVFAFLAGVPLTAEQALAASSPSSPPLPSHIPTIPSPNLSWLLAAAPQRYLQQLPELIANLVPLVRGSSWTGAKSLAGAGEAGKAKIEDSKGEKEAEAMSSDMFYVAVNRMIAWGATPSLSLWLTAVLSGLASSFQFSTLSALSSHASSLLLSQLLSPSHRAGALWVQRQLWLTHDVYSPKAFHGQLKRIRTVNEYLVRQREEEEKRKTGDVQAAKREEQAMEDTKEDGREEKRRKSDNEAASEVSIAATSSASASIVSTVTTTPITSGLPAPPQTVAPPSTSSSSASSPSIDLVPSSFISSYAELLFALMYHFHGFPELYFPIRQQLLALEQKPPADAQLEAILQQHAWKGTTGQPAPQLHSPAFVASKKLALGLAGLENSGNSCYQSCVLQSLFLTDAFTSSLLQFDLSFQEKSQHRLFFSLQSLFSYLLLSLRPSVKATTLAQCLPPMFKDASQQDAGEFVKWLLEGLQEQWKKAKKEREKRKSENVQTATAVNNESNVGLLSASQSPVAEEASAVKPPDRSSYLTTQPTRGSVKGGSPLPQSSPPPAASAMLSLPAASTTTSTSAFVAAPASSSSFSSSSSLSTLDVDPFFGGVMRSCVCCLRCGNESARLEAVMEIPLAMEQQDEEQKREKEKAAAKAREQARAHTEKSAEEEKMKDTTTPSITIASAPPSSLSLVRMLDLYLSPELLSGSNAYFCSHCSSKQSATKTLSLTALSATSSSSSSPISFVAPEHLLIALKRNEYNWSTGSRKKIMTPVDYPAVLQLPIFSVSNTSPVASSSAPSANSSSSGRETAGFALYVLYSVVFHSGSSSQSGHYYTIARHSEAARQLAVQQMAKQQFALENGSNSALHASRFDHHRLESGCREHDRDGLDPPDAADPSSSAQWFSLNDHHVRQTSWSVLSSISSTFPNDVPYLFFYRKFYESPASTPSPSSSMSSFQLPPSQCLPPANPLRQVVSKDNERYLQEQQRQVENHRAIQMQLQQAQQTYAGFRQHGQSGSNASARGDDYLDPDT